MLPATPELLPNLAWNFDVAFLLNRCKLESMQGRVALTMGRAVSDFSDEAVECERRAMRYRSEAVATVDPILRDLLFDIEDRWLSLAEGYRSAQRAMDAAIEGRNPRAA
jgi:hypothetical protein